MVGSLPEQVPYQEWQHSAFVAEEVGCQSCHMPAVGTRRRVEADEKNDPGWGSSRIRLALSHLVSHPKTFGRAGWPAHDGAPQVLLATVVDRDEQLVKVPGVTEPPASMPESACVGVPEGAAPLPNGLVGDGDAALGEQVFHISKAQAEPKVEPDGVSDDVWRESISMVARRGTADHPTTLPPSTST